LRGAFVRRAQVTRRFTPTGEGRVYRGFSMRGKGFNCPPTQLNAESKAGGAWAGLKEDLEFTEKVLELGEFGRAKKMCRHMISLLSNSPNEVDAVNGFRSLLITAMIETRSPSEVIVDEIDRLFTGYLTTQDRASAAQTLGRKGGLSSWPWWARGLGDGL
jgi:hypothetical protein